MKIKNVVPVFALSGLLLITSCDMIVKDTASDKNEKLIAQKLAETEKVEEKLPTIIEFTSVDKGFSILTSAIKASDMAETLEGDARFTIFAPINMAFDKLSEGTVENLLKPENKEKLATILKYHIIPSVISKEDIVIAINEGRGSVPLKTLAGTRLTATLKGDNVFLIDEMGNGGRLITTDVEASNGFIHTIEAVMMPKK